MFGILSSSFVFMVSVSGFCFGLYFGCDLLTERIEQSELGRFVMEAVDLLPSLLLCKNKIDNCLLTVSVVAVSC